MYPNLNKHGSGGTIFPPAAVDRVCHLTKIKLGRGANAMSGRIKTVLIAHTEGGMSLNILGWNKFSIKFYLEVVKLSSNDFEQTDRTRIRPGSA